MRRRVGLLLAGLGLAAAGPLSGQGKPIELGIDGGFTTQLTDPKVSTIGLPVQQVRVGFFATDRVEIEPALAFNWIKYSGEDALTTIGLDVGVAVHFSTDTERPRAYLRPMVGLDHAAAGGSSSTALSAGGGVGVKVPIRSASHLEFRLEAGYIHGFKHETDGVPASDRLRLLFGLSFLTK